ncbi:hypothetical protein JHK87_011923 [Glycine soja]|nr:hypothetical protein JHK87_011923 [Glycine soja]
MQEAEQILQTRHFNLSNKTFQSESSRTICTPRKHAFSSSAVSKNFILGNIIEEIEKTERPSHKEMSSKSQNRTLLTFATRLRLPSKTVSVPQPGRVLRNDPHATRSSGWGAAIVKLQR